VDCGSDHLTVVDSRVVVAVEQLQQVLDAVVVVPGHKQQVLVLAVVPGQQQHSNDDDVWANVVQSAH